MVSYAITRMQWKLSRLVYNIFLAGMMIPIYAMIIPLFSIFKNLGLLDNYLSVIIPHIAIGLPMSIFIICGFMQGIPGELEEAAIIEDRSQYLPMLRKDYSSNLKIFDCNSRCRPVHQYME